MTTLEKLTAVFREVFDDEAIRIERDTTANDIEEWDSFSHVNLILAVETRFGIRFTQKELVNFKNVGDLLDSIDGKSR